MHDPAWDMPKENWAQQGSFEQGLLPPIGEPDGGTLVCLPPINQDWLPYVLGCIDQMRNPSCWIVADDDAMAGTLSRVDRLKAMFGGRAECAVPYELRFTDGCLLQFSTDVGETWTDVAGWDANFPACNPPQIEIRLTSTCLLQNSFDGGATWSDVPGWDTYFGGCVQDAVPIIGLPPNPGDQAPDQLTCSIASYLANVVIQNALQAAVTAIQDDLTLLSFGANVLNLIPEFLLVRLGYDAVAIIYAAVADGTLSDYEAALTDGALWEYVVCAIYGAIRADGFVTPGNFAAIQAAIAGIPYAHSDVITAIGAYITSLGAGGLAQLSQRAGLETGADCSGCGSWCIYIDFSLGVSDWGPNPSNPGAFYDGVAGHWSGGDNGAGQFVCDIFTAGIDGFISSIRIRGTMGTTSGGEAPYNASDPSDSVPQAALPPGDYDINVPIGRTWTGIGISMGSVTTVGVGMTIADITVRGTGTRPTLQTNWAAC